MQKHFFYILLVLLAFGYSAKAQTPVDTLQLSLNKAIELGLKENLNLKNANLDYLVAKKKVWEVTAAGLPQATATGTYTYLPKLPMIDFGGSPMELGVHNSRAIDGTASQLIFNGEWIVGLQAASVYERLQNKTLYQTEYKTRESIISAYNSVLIIEESYKNLSSTLDATSKLYENTKALNQQGFIEESDVDQLKIMINNLSSGVETLHNQIDVVNMLLKMQLGVEFNQPIKLTNTLNQLVELAPIQPITADSFDVKSSVEYQLAETAETLSKLSLRREYTKFLPTLAGFYAYHHSLTDEALAFQAENTFGLKLSIPILTGGARLATLSQAKLNYKKAQNSKILAQQGLTTEYLATRNGYISAYNTYLNSKESMELGFKVYNKTVVKYQEGVVTSMELTTSQNQYLLAQKSFYEAELNLLNAKAKLERLLTNANN